MDKKIKDWGIFGFIVYLLSMPILIWKSSKIGRAISVFLLALVLLWVSDKGFSIFSRIQAKFVIQANLKPVLKEIKEIDEYLRQSHTRLANYWVELEKAQKQLGIEIKDDIMSKISEKKFDEQITEIEKNISIMREGERDALKERILDIKEQVKIYKKSIDSKEIRLLCERVSISMGILTPEEKERFAQDLKDIGFGVEKVIQQVNGIMVYDGQEEYVINGGWSQGACVTANSVYFAPQVYRKRN